MNFFSAPLTPCRQINYVKSRVSHNLKCKQFTFPSWCDFHSFRRTFSEKLVFFRSHISRKRKRQRLDDIANENDDDDGSIIFFIHSTCRFSVLVPCCSIWWHSMSIRLWRDGKYSLYGRQRRNPLALRRPRKLVDKEKIWQWHRRIQRVSLSRTGTWRRHSAKAPTASK